jgi:rubrerythrin
MDKKTKNEVINILFRAMQAETDGHLFCKSAAKNTEDSQGKEVFESLAKDELDHLHFLRAQHKSITESGEPDKDLKVGKPLRDLKEISVFSDEFKSRLTQAHNEMSALSIGIHLELAQMDFYKTQAKEVMDQTIKPFFGELAEWESSHYHRLIRQQEELKEDYWFKGGFYPF